MFIALLISLLAGLTTTLGGLLATHKRMIERPVLSVSLAFAAGAILFLSFMELLPHAIGGHSQAHEATPTHWLVYGTFFLGMALVALVDRLLPASFNPSEIEGREDELDGDAKRANKKLFRSGILVALVLALHNFPEGLSTFLASYQNLSLGITLAVAIAIHNVPLGISIAAPIYASTGSRKRAIFWATVSGFTGLIGALVGVLLVGAIVPDELMGIMFGLVAGMMVFVALDELLPAAKRYQTNMHQVVYGTSAGMAVVAISLLLL